MNNLQDAIKEAFTVAPSNVVVLHTLEISHSDIETLRIVNNNEDLTFTLEDLVGYVFEGVGFRHTLPPAGDNGIQELTLVIDNVDQRITDTINAVKRSREPCIVKYRPFLSNDLTTPQMNPPLVLNLTGVQITMFEAQGKNSFQDLINKKAPSELYTRKRFPSLGG